MSKFVKYLVFDIVYQMDGWPERHQREGSVEVEVPAELRGSDIRDYIATDIAENADWVSFRYYDSTTRQTGLVLFPV